MPEQYPQPNPEQPTDPAEISTEAHVDAAQPSMEALMDWVGGNGDITSKDYSPARAREALEVIVTQIRQLPPNAIAEANTLWVYHDRLLRTYTAYLAQRAGAFNPGKTYRPRDIDYS